MKKKSSNIRGKWWVRLGRSLNWFAFRYWWFVWFVFLLVLVLFLLNCCHDEHRTYDGELGRINELIEKNCPCGDVQEETPLEELTFPADYLIITYQFDRQGGKDLDTRTSILSPIQSEEVGYCNRNSRVISQYILWSGDNRGYGVESCLIDLTKFDEDAEVVISCAATWWSLRESGDMSLDIRAYRGGRMNKTNFQFYNVGGEESAYTSFEDNIEYCCERCPITEEIGVIKYNKQSQTLTFIPDNN